MHRSTLHGCDRSAPLPYRRVLVVTVLLMGVVQGVWAGAAGAFVPRNIVRPIAAGYHVGIITHDPGDAFSLTASGDTVVAAGYRWNSDANDRAVFWSDGSAVAATEQTCDSWTSADPEQQEGVALRITFRSGVTKALTVTKNIWGGANWFFNVHFMDSGDVRTPFVLLGQFDVAPAVSRSRTDAAGPWHLCARTVGDELSFVVWRAGEPQPAYGTPGEGGSVSIPSEVPSRGFAGWYFGHIRADGSIDYTDLSATAR